MTLEACSAEPYPESLPTHTRMDKFLPVCAIDVHSKPDDFAYDTRSSWLKVDAG
ncbi:hypothetical protein FACS1894122_14550 [Alphaproteobacteria bacterium]|nr:hypothetical protein FACS1894122_14550 [Alphaproteobacteria bacterium]